MSCRLSPMNRSIRKVTINRTKNTLLRELMKPFIEITNQLKNTQDPIVIAKLNAIRPQIQKGNC